MWLVGRTWMRLIEECVWSNEEDKCNVRYLFGRASGVVGEEIDLERWMTILDWLWIDGGLL